MTNAYNYIPEKLEKYDASYLNIKQTYQLALHWNESLNLKLEFGHFQSEK